MPTLLNTGFDFQRKRPKPKFRSTPKPPISAPPDADPAGIAPPWEEVFGPRPCEPFPVENEDELSPAMEIANRECARLLGNICLYDPPIEEKEIAAFARRTGVSLREGELEIRRLRNG